jgi:Lon protease-like protein
MNRATGDLRIGDLPLEVPLFPLSGSLLLPGGRLPLNIFEPRYLMMVDDAIAEGRFVGMIQPRQTGAETVGDEAPIYQTGCVGRITAFAETDDGRVLLTLTGLARFRIEAERALKNGYRRARVSYEDFGQDLDHQPIEGFVRQPFIDALQAYFSANDINGSWEALEKADEATLIISVAMSAPFSPEEKQAMLECRTLAELGELLSSLMTMSVHEKEGASGPVRH